MPGEKESANIRVAVRVRPLNKDKEAGCERCVDVDQESRSISITVKGPVSAQPQSFFFDCVFPESTTNNELYNEIGAPILDAAFNSYNGTIFAYGQTGAGKTFSMSGVSGMPGIVPLMNAELFKRVSHTVANAVQPVEFLIQASYLEIYMEKIRDLLNPAPPGELRVREGKEGIYVDNLSKITVKSASEVLELIMQGNKMRQVAATGMNETSSRSHAIFTVFLQSRLKNVKEVIAKRLISEGESHEESFDTGAIKSCINLVDLAGSERQRDTGATGLTAKQGIAINLSLTCLGNVINSLVQKSAHVPYRDSVLTRILQDSLGGRSSTVMLANVSPADKNAAETLSTLKYANRAKQIVNKIERNETKTDRLIREMREEIERLKRVLAERDAALHSGQQQLQAQESQQQEQQQEKEEKGNNETQAKPSEEDMAQERKNQLALLLESMKLHDEDEEENWDDIERRSDELNRIRIENLKKMTFYGALLDSIREEYTKAIRLVREGEEGKRNAKRSFKRIRKETKTKKTLMDEAQAKYKNRLAELEKRIQEGDTSVGNPKKDILVVEYKRSLNEYRDAYNNDIMKLRKLKQDIERFREQVKTAENDAAASNAFITGDRKLREEIARAERQRLEKSNAKKMEEERQRLFAEYEAEVNKACGSESYSFDNSSSDAEDTSLSLHTSCSSPNFRNNLQPLTIPTLSPSSSASTLSPTSATTREAARKMARINYTKQLTEVNLQLVESKAREAKLEDEVKRLRAECAKYEEKIAELKQRFKDYTGGTAAVTAAMEEMRERSKEYISKILQKSREEYNKLLEENERLRGLVNKTTMSSSPLDRVGRTGQSGSN